MTNEEKTIRIAVEIMEWKIGTPSTGYPGVIDDGNIWIDEGGVYLLFDRGGWWHEWNPRTRWDHAGMLLDRLEESYNIEIGNRSEDSKDKWYCCLMRPEPAPWILAGGNTVPAAIFNAAYATLEEIAP